MMSASGNYIITQMNGVSVLKLPYDGGASMIVILPDRRDGLTREAFVDTNESGTEAAAATAVTFSEPIAPPAPPSISFVADHPFLYLIRDDASGAILFVGRVTDPSQG